MKHAYLIVIHTNFKILNMLLETLDRKENDFYILIDKKVKIQDREIIRYTTKYSNVHLLPRVIVNWGGYSQINAVLLLLKEAAKNGYDYYHFMQGSDFPIKSADAINSFFEEHNGYEFVDFDPKNYEFAKVKCNYYHPFCNSRLFRICRPVRWISYTFAEIQRILRLGKDNQQLYNGSALFSITHRCAEFVISNEDYIQRRYSHSMSADEVFLQTLLMNSDFKDKIYCFEKKGSNCYLIDWQRKSGNSPYTFTSADFDMLVNSDEKFLFARKFSENVDFEVVQKLFRYLQCVRKK